MLKMVLRLPGTQTEIGKMEYNFENIGKNRKQMRIIFIYLEPEYRGKGFGQKIIEYVIGKAKKLGCVCIVTDLTIESFDLYSPYKKRRKFFENAGFKFDKEGGYARLDL